MPLHTVSTCFLSGGMHPRCMMWNSFMFQSTVQRSIPCVDALVFMLVQSQVLSWTWSASGPRQKELTLKNNKKLLQDFMMLEKLDLKEKNNFGRLDVKGYNASDKCSPAKLSQTNFSSRFYPALMAGICCQQTPSPWDWYKYRYKMSSLTSSISYWVLSCSLYSPVTDCPLMPNCKPSFSVSFKPNVLYYTLTTSSVKKILVLLSKAFALCINPPHLWISLLILNII